MEEERICTCCGNTLTEYEGTVVDEELLCDECTEERCIVCDECGEAIWANECVTDDRIFLCRECFDENYYNCSGCDRIIHENNVNWYNNQPYCDNCYDELDSDDEIEDYNYKPVPIFYGKRKLYMGI